jgi:hypothetical protein
MNHRGKEVAVEIRNRGNLPREGRLARWIGLFDRHLYGRLHCRWVLEKVTRENPVEQVTEPQIPRRTCR